MTELEPPKAKRVDTKIEKHGDVRVDPYYWLKERESPEVIAHLEQENAYLNAALSATEELQESLFEEIKGRLEPDESSVPYRKDGYFYYYRYEKEGEYPLYCRKPGSLDAGEQVYLDGNSLAEGHDYFQLRVSGLSHDHRIAAYAIDTEGRRIYSIYFKNLETGETLPDVIADVTSNLAWANDATTVFYTKQDPETLRAYRIYRHRLGTDASEDVLIYEEKDDTFTTHIYKTKSKRYLIIASEQTVASEVRYLAADEPEGTFRLFQERERHHEYGVSQFGDHFYILTNREAKNFRLMRTPLDQTGVEHWDDVVPHRDSVLLEDFELFRDYLVTVERRDGLRHLRIRPWSGEEEHDLAFDDPTYDTYLTGNAELETRVLRFGYTSLTTPSSTYDYDMKSKQRTLLKVDKVLGGFERENYKSERFAATASDGTSVPISLVYHKNTVLEDKPPLLLYGYGSYGINMEASFSSSRLSLLDRGFVYAIAHIRGSEVLGRRWYEDGKLLKKNNTFTDFIACAEHLVAAGYADPTRVFAMGGSAGGLLIGAVANMRPELFRGVVAHVPFVDVVTTMLDDSIPLTTGEYDEWGDPNDKTYYDYMMSYSPYDNIEPKDYPHMLVTAGLYDSQVQYWEPAKWVAKLRATKTDDNRLLLKTNMDAGHHGASGRYRRLREAALAYAFLLDLANE